MKLRINVGNKDATKAQDDAISKAYGSKFILPLDFEMLGSSIPYYQAGLGTRVCYEITFNNYDQATGQATPADMYKTTDITLKYEIIT